MDWACIPNEYSTLCVARSTEETSRRFIDYSYAEGPLDDPFLRTGSVSVITHRSCPNGPYVPTYL